jgi:putative oxidoreductase
MKLLKGIVTRRTAGYDVLRIAVCLLLSVHGGYRFYEGSLPVLAGILDARGFPFAIVLVWLVNLAETGGTLLLALRILAVPISLILAGSMRRASYCSIGARASSWSGRARRAGSTALC